MTITIINGKRYNTKTATKIAHYWNNYAVNDFHYCEEVLYRTKNGNWFIDGSGGALSKYSEPCGNMTSAGDKIVPISSKEALAWLEEHEEIDALEEYFSNEIQDA